MKQFNKDKKHLNIKQIQRMRQVKDNQCGGCGLNPVNALHKCPMIMHDPNNNTLCNCCNDCVRNCERSVF